MGQETSADGPVGIPAEVPGSTGQESSAVDPVGTPPEVPGSTGQENSAADLVGTPAEVQPEESPRADVGPVEIDPTELLACYGLTVWPAEIVQTPDDAVAAAERLGWPVVLKAADPEAAKRAGTVRLGLTSPAAVRQAHADLAGQLGADVVLAVQKMAPQPAVPTVVNVLEDPAFGPVVSFGLGDVTARLLRDRGYRLAPLTAEDAAGLVRSVEAAPLLFGEYGYPPVAVGALQELLVRVGRLANDLPEVARLDLDPVLVGESEVFVLGARAVLRSPEGPRRDGGPRRLA
ncbi:acetate--CoA ligase family protein [Nonomuraea recticatena]|uniref:acetate--CoA ligase family protein n=1 Tax=Nonomuraea recticatena TaxID=46178 RepID=UPI0036073A62